MTKETKPLITYDWFPKHAKFYLSNYDFPVFPEDFAYYLMKDNKTLIMISAVKNINQNYLKNLDAKELSRYVGFADTEIGELARTYLNECSTTVELKAKIAPIFCECNVPEEFAIQIE